MLSDIEISRQTKLLPIADVANKLGIDEQVIEPYGRYIAKLPLNLIDNQRLKQSKLILVTSISPTLAGIGKTTVSVGLTLGLNYIGKAATVALREPSLGPCFGRKGGAAGGGYAQVLPMEKINLHFTGDFHAITSAHNMISALLDNYDHFNAGTPDAVKERLWKRVLDVNDRQLRQIVTGLGGSANGRPIESGFDITAASEIMAILCLAADLDDLRQRIDNILLGFRVSGQPLYLRDLKVGGAIVTLLKDALNPNLVQTTENTPALVHGGPFANIAHGCNSVIASKMALSLSDYVVTEAGFGADLGAEKFFDIKCRSTGLQPSLTVIVATIRGLKMHGGVAPDAIAQPNTQAVVRGLENLQRHLDNLRGFGQSVVIAFNRFGDDTDEEIAIVRQHAETQGIGFAINNAFAKGGEGAAELAQLVVDTIEKNPSQPLRFTYENEDDVETKINKVATHIYGAASVHLQPNATKMLKRIKELGLAHLPVCIAKTQFSFSADPKAYGAVKDFDFEISDLVINSGAGFIVALAGNMMRMPGLPRDPQALHIDVVNGEIVGLS